MYKIIKKEVLNPTVTKMVVEAPVSYTHLMHIADNRRKFVFIMTSRPAHRSFCLSVNDCVCITEGRRNAMSFVYVLSLIHILFL